MWPFKNKVEVYRFKYLDWDKVKTTEDLISVLRGANFLRDIQVSETYWDKPGFKNLIGNRVVEKTFVNNRLDNIREYDE
jgi:hypothetical protein